MNKNPHNPHDDELLSALIDGELPDDEAKKLKARLAQDASLARRYEELYAANTAAGEAYADVLTEPLPSEVTRLLKPESYSNIVPFRRFGSSHVWTAVAAMAAGVLIAMVVFNRPVDSDPTAFLTAGRVTQDSAYHQVLSETPSGEIQSINAGLTMAPRFSYVNSDGVPCRRVDLRGTSMTIETVSCYREGEWQVDLVAYAPPLAEGEFYGTASGSASNIDAAVDGEPLDLQTEREWMDRGWDK